MSSPCGSQDSFAVGLYKEPDPFESSQTEGTEVAQGGVSGVARQNAIRKDPSSQQQTQLQPEKLGFFIEKQPVKWAELFCAGKKLRLNLSFNYVETTHMSVTSSRKGDKRGSSSITQQMLTERAEQLDAEQESSGQPSIWRDVYNLMRCPGPPCHLGPHCWRDPVGKKHYKLKTHHLKGLIRYVEHGYQLQTHGDVPEDIRQQLYAEGQQWLERRQRATNTTTGNFPPINITNVLPAQSYQAPLGASAAGTPPSDIPSISTPVNRLDIPGHRDVAVKKYSDWQQSQVINKTLKLEFQKACDITLADGLDLEQIYSRLQNRLRPLSLKKIVVALRCAIFQNLEVLVFLALAKMDGFQSRKPSYGVSAKNG
ncbi:uncharacterized protein PAC_15241 [Phialocephala subalpina]|uniref:Uncharacterized protein n=1 Tax=Phialocephala subalpina TaxID=576137 RepID=A0A1L7XJV7_9HELO|nr:uncharacterized protein PAC_15241 [Phialocephala subalpina]